MNPRILPAALLLAIGLLPALAAATDATATAGERRAEAPARPKIGLALSGGGARGAAHIGVLKVLEELRVPVDVIAGTSAGGIMGGFYAAGLSPEEMAQSLIHLDWDAVLSDRPSRERLSYRLKEKDRTDLFELELGVRDFHIALSQGLIAGHNLNFYLRGVTLRSAGITDFDRLPIPFRAVATDLETGEAVILGGGELADALRASMAVPGIFTPVEIDGRLLVDGGMSSQLPIDIVRALGADVVIAVNIGTPPHTRDGLGTLFDISSQTLSFLTRKNTAEQLQRLTARDLLIEPPLPGVSVADFVRAADIIELGEQTARLHGERLRALSVSEAEYAAWRARQRVEPGRPIHLNRVGIARPERVARKRVLARLRTEAGRPLDLAALEDDLTRIYDLGDFERVDYRLIGDGSEKDLEIQTRAKSWGPNYLRFGLSLVDDFEGDSRFNLLTDFTLTALNRLGGEWKNELSIGHERRFLTELYQPLDYAGRFFVAPRFQYRQDIRDVYEDDRRVAQYRSKRAGAGLDVGAQFLRGGELRLGIVRDRVEAAPRIGAATLPSYNIQQGAYVANLVYDKLDNVNFPRHGHALLTRLYLARDDLGADATYDKLLVDWLTAGTRGRHTLLAGLRLGSALGTELPFYDSFELGGFLELSGYLTGQLQGQHLGLARLMYYYQTGRMPGTGSRVFVGGSLEAGNVWERRERMRLDDLHKGGSVFTGVDSVLGPLYLAYGYSEGGRDAFYLLLGKNF